jgi:hypothetical protein
MLAIILFGLPFGMVAETIYLYASEIAKPPSYMNEKQFDIFRFYSKMIPYFFLMGFLMGLPLILRLQIYTIMGAFWLKIITYPSLLAQYAGFAVSIFITWACKTTFLGLNDMRGKYTP